MTRHAPQASSAAVVNGGGGREPWAPARSDGVKETRSAQRELWAFCGVCARWFFVEKSEDPEHRRIACPVCAVPSAIFHNRSDTKHRVARGSRPLPSVAAVEQLVVGEGFEPS